MDNSLIRFWAKTTHDKNDKGLQNAYHPLICHLIDVANTAKAIWDQVLPKITKERLARSFCLENDHERAGTLIAFLAGLHDLGKCSPPFTLRGKNNPRNEQTIRLLELYADMECDCDNFETASKVP